LEFSAPRQSTWKGSKQAFAAVDPTGRFAPPCRTGVGFAFAPECRLSRQTDWIHKFGVKEPFAVARMEV